MLLTLRILTYRNQPVPPAPAVRFGEAGGNIGRSAENTLVLDDPSRYISRVHARVFVQDGAFMLEDLGSNASVVNDKPVGKGVQVALAHGDRVLLGDYLLQAVVETAPATPALAPAPRNDTALPLFEPPAPAPPPQLPALDFAQAPAPAAAVATLAPGLLDPLAGASILDVLPGQQAFASDPLGLNLLAPAPARPRHGADSDHVSPELAALGRRQPQAGAAPSFVPALAASAGAGFAIPQDYDPLADFLPLAPAAPAPPPAAPAAPAQPPTVPAHWPAAAPPPSAAPAHGLDPTEPTPAEQTAIVPAVVPRRAPPPAPERPPSAPPAMVAPGAQDEVLAALLRGLGLPDLQLQRPATEVAETVGAMLREATAGTIDVLMARAVTKMESRIERTMLSVRANNPLKFFPNADGALTQMLTGAMAGYMAPRDAVAGAFDDLRAHELAVIAGMRAALGAVLHRFDPAQIEARLAVPTVMDKVLSANRKAKLWDRLVEVYGEIAREADDDLQRLYGEKFSEAYEEQVARLRQAKERGPR
ncbi:MULTISPECIES: type VI secretion system-associated FHA domain protein TagH [unclassified Massilia]|uniref:type VI secretion system-associated FHA domain protein TagH n=1 Tax=unclassified Massilia TaxID=2609279 RepID=UPI001786994B|nr:MULTISPECIES: type VI secretion system-associated FHA domain protein TagH [unclassified Massilia]MBD8528369.1 type VI secretion system-associated FHA domain protein TagH [Massilia sp. CFBP 13647]MBD8672009.1 type VI secretion system-associated FHA domain protein TagH [Massilia sp. CFBP 13721]